MAVAAAIGGLIGAELGSRKQQSNGIRRALAAVLVIAGLKLMLTSRELRRIPRRGSSENSNSTSFSE